MGKNKSLARKSVSSLQAFSGPLPPPKILEDYNRIVPGLAERIIIQTEEEGKHRRILERQSLTENITKSYLGMLCGFLIGIAGMSLSTYIIVSGYSVSGTVFGSTTIISLVYVFVTGKKLSLKEIQENKQAKVEKSQSPSNQ